MVGADFGEGKGNSLDRDARLTNIKWVLPEGAWAEGRVRRSLSVILNFEKSCQCCHYLGGEVIW